MCQTNTSNQDTNWGSRHDGHDEDGVSRETQNKVENPRSGFIRGRHAERRCGRNPQPGGAGSRRGVAMASPGAEEGGARTPRCAAALCRAACTRPQQRTFRSPQSRCVDDCTTTMRRLCDYACCCGTCAVLMCHLPLRHLPHGPRSAPSRALRRVHKHGVSPRSCPIG